MTLAVERRRAHGTGTAWRTVAAVAVLVLAYGAVISAGDSRVGSGSDAGGKVATTVVMGERGSLRPDVGYWAEGVDPDGVHHPLWNTRPMGDAWVQATSLPFQIAAVPFWDLGGAAGLLVLPIAGGVVAALAAKRLCSRLGVGAGWPAFWLVGAAGPVLFYTGDFWEHAPAVGLALLAVAVALDAERPSHAAVAGLLAGIAAVLRAEIVVYGAAFALTTLLIPEERRRWVRRPRMIATALVAAAGPLVVNAVLERLLLDGGVRDGRAAEGLSVAGHGLGGRLVDALVTSVGIFPTDEPIAVLLGAAVVLGLGTVAAHARWPDRVSVTAARAGAIVAIGLYAIRLASGPGFVPGFLVVAPLAVIGAVGARGPREQLLAGTALVAVPVVAATAWQGNHVAQWGGRYLLLSGALLTVVGVAALERAGWRTPASVVALGLTVTAGTAGVVWHVERSRTIADAVARIEDRPAEVVIVSDLPHLGREAGFWYGDHRWLSTAQDRGIEETIAVAVAAGASRVAVVQAVDDGEAPADNPEDGSLQPRGEERLPWLVGEELLVRDYAIR